MPKYRFYFYMIRFDLKKRFGKKITVLYLIIGSGASQVSLGLHGP